MDLIFLSKIVYKKITNNKHPLIFIKNITFTVNKQNNNINKFLLFLSQKINNCKYKCLIIKEYKNFTMNTSQTKQNPFNRSNPFRLPTKFNAQKINYINHSSSNIDLAYSKNSLSNNHLQLSKINYWNFHEDHNKQKQYLPGISSSMRTDDMKFKKQLQLNSANKLLVKKNPYEKSDLVGSARNVKDMNQLYYIPEKNIHKARKTNKTYDDKYDNYGKLDKFEKAKMLDNPFHRKNLLIVYDQSLEIYQKDLVYNKYLAKDAIPPPRDSYSRQSLYSHPKQEINLNKNQMNNDSFVFNYSLSINNLPEKRSSIVNDNNSSHRNSNKKSPSRQSIQPHHYKKQIPKYITRNGKKYFLDKVFPNKN